MTLLRLAGPRAGRLVLFAAGLVAAVAAAAPLHPAGDDEVVETLPTLGPYVREQRLLRRQLAAAPRDPQVALALSRSLLERARHDGDARLAGQALGALRAWDGDDAAPPAIALQRATLRQYLHDFDGAADDLARLLQRAPRDAQALITLATVRRVQARYDDADAACRQLDAAGQPAYAEACLAENAGRRGRTDEARRRLSALLGPTAGAPATPAWTAWIRTSLGELELGAGRADAALAQLQAARRADGDDHYVRDALVDALIARRRWAEAEALLGTDDSEAGLLRRAIVARALDRPDATALRDTLAARYAQAGLRPEALAVHARERARFALDVEDDAPRALALARLNLQTQREPVDFVVMQRAATAARDGAALAELQALAERHGLRDARLGAAPGAAP